MGTPQIIYIFLMILNLMISSYQHGKPKEGKYNIWATIVSCVLSVWLMIAGGFFR